MFYSQIVQDEICSLLLQYDVLLFGSCIFDVCSQKKITLIEGIAPYTSKVYLERALFKYSIETGIHELGYYYYKVVGTKSATVYTVHIRYTAKEGVFKYREPDACFDTELMGVCNKGIILRYLPDSMHMHPNMFKEVYTNLLSKKYAVLQRFRSSYVTEKLMKYIHMGWKNKLAHYSPQFNETKCSICLKPIRSKEQGRTLECCHSYHAECISKHIYVNLEEDKTPSCPKCRSEISTVFI